jgi:hypothetical protein
MKKIYRIIPDPSAPELILEGGLAERLVGESVTRLSPDRPFEGHVERLADWNQFYRVGTNAFALSEAAWDNCEQMYYALRENSIEFPAVRTASGDFAVIHPLQFLPQSHDPSQLCDLTYASTIFRIRSRPPLEVFCLEGIAVPNDEIKRACDIYGFTGLIFEEVWSGE